MKKFELVFIPIPGSGHLASMFEMANSLLARDHRLAVTMIAIKLPLDAKVNEYIQSLYAQSLTNNSIKFIILPELPPPPNDENKIFFEVVLESYKPHVKQALISFLTTSTNHLVGFVLDSFCLTMVDVANEFKVPSYVYYTSSAAYLAFSLHLEQLYTQDNSSNEVIQQSKDSNVNFSVSSLVNQVPSKVIPSVFFINNFAVWFHEQAKRIRFDVKGVLINTFDELESHVISSLSTDSSLQLPPLYPVGPILHLNKNTETMDDRVVLKWLDDQPLQSVVFLCFGSRGAFQKDQVEEIARALERSRVRFIWSLRRPSGDVFQSSIDYTNFEDILPEGFLDRTKNIGRVIKWAPQVEILGHPTIGGFVSHCGWNSTLESLWYGIPMATWPMYAEQQFNAFELVVELGLAVEITIDYQNDLKELDKPRILSAEEIEKGIRKLMDDNNNEIRKKVKTKSEECRKSVIEGGSSFISLGKFIDDVLINSPRGAN
ncbi:anthocyanidin 3-O-glucosyltransferase 2-like [Cucumis melo var. makuwa]|uniref:Glycosyltransferase n=2 Tax=Cucumis melo TaxID=3656 RepID=A0A5D3DW35_CUCMM|nr:anthocyanidin 3-O-glucosyltransferase 2-like [Cucumis melo var. makuwa]TYK28027.1 anthocyanidin 3-O-glucosyltransferase 2-like [Cucumis melo var. makuwa]